jgi:hypothetical protein
MYVCIYIYTPSCWWSPECSVVQFSILVQRTPVLFTRTTTYLVLTVKSAKSLYCWLAGLSEARVNPRYFWTAPFPSHHSLVKIRSIILNHVQSLFWLVSYLCLSHIVYKYIYVHIHIFIYIVYHVFYLLYICMYVCIMNTNHKCPPFCGWPQPFFVPVPGRPAGPALPAPRLGHWIPGVCMIYCFYTGFIQNLSYTVFIWCLKGFYVILYDVYMICIYLIWFIYVYILFHVDIIGLSG